jgi:hypothetical protein
MSNSITMTNEQTETYDADELASAELMTELRAEARRIMEQTGQPVEIYTADGILAEFVQ